MRHAPSTPLSVREEREWRAREAARLNEREDRQRLLAFMADNVERFERRLAAVREELCRELGDLCEPLTLEVALNLLDRKTDLQDFPRGRARELRVVEGECLTQIDRLKAELAEFEARDPDAPCDDPEVRAST